VLLLATTNGKLTESVGLDPKILFLVIRA